jgi:flagellar FliL protein
MAQPTIATNDPASATQPPRFLGAKGKLLAVAFVLLVILVECILALFLLPSADQTRAASQLVLAGEQTSQNAGQGLTGLEELDDQPRKEIDLGEFDVSSYQPLSNTTLRISVHLYGTVRPENETELMALIEAKQQRMREQVLVTLRSAEVTDLTDAGLGLIKRKILEKINRTLGKPLLEQIVFSEFSFFEQ